MPFVMFNEYFPETGAQETRNLIILEESKGLPADTYTLFEMYCNEPGCDCRRVLFYVVSSSRNKMVGVVGWGWEDAEFYKRWMKDDDPEIIRGLMGPALNPGSPQSDLGPAVVELIKDIALQDEEYVERIKNHYRMFREKIDGKKPPSHKGKKKRLKKKKWKPV
ncbi:MAG: hypothetical protein R6V10_02070 [bacterium]